MFALAFTLFALVFSWETDFERILRQQGLRSISGRNTRMQRAADDGGFWDGAKTGIPPGAIKVDLKEDKFPLERCECECEGLSRSCDEGEECVDHFCEEPWVPCNSDKECHALGRSWNCQSDDECAWRGPSYKCKEQGPAGTGISWSKRCEKVYDWETTPSPPTVAEVDAKLERLVRLLREAEDEDEFVDQWGDEDEFVDEDDFGDEDDFESCDSDEACAKIGLAYYDCWDDKECAWREGNWKCNEFGPYTRCEEVRETTPSPETDAAVDAKVERLVRLLREADDEDDFADKPWECDSDEACAKLGLEYGSCWDDDECAWRGPTWKCNEYGTITRCEDDNWTSTSPETDDDPYLYEVDDKLDRLVRLADSLERAIARGN